MAENSKIIFYFFFASSLGRVKFPIFLSSFFLEAFSSYLKIILYERD